MQDSAKKIIEIIAANFPNGIRDDFIDTGKVLRIYSANCADENISRDLIADVIHANGTEYGGRFYFVSEKIAEDVKQFAAEILETRSIVYYSAVHEKHADFFSRMHIFSPDVLKKILQKIDERNFYYDEFFSASKMTRLNYEVSKIFMAAENSLSLDDLQEKLPYVPPEKILAVLADTKKYLPTNAGRFASISNIKFDTDEIHAAKQQIISAIDANGFATVDDYDLSSNFALNPELAENDLRNVIYEKFFAVDFTKHGRRLFRNGTVIKRSAADSVNRLREFIAEQEEISAEKLFAVAESFGVAQHVALYVAHEKMIRADKNLFVKDSLMSFDVAGVDEALASFVQDKIISLRSVTSFTGFPPVEGYTWNLFLLESFLRKFSRQYIYAAPAANSANVGAIYPKTMRFKKYKDLQVAVVVQENVPLEKIAVEEFLVKRGYRANRIAKITDEIIKRAGNFRSLKN